MAEMDDFRPQIPEDWTPELYEITTLESRLKNNHGPLFGRGDNKPRTETEVDLKIEEDIIHHEQMVVKLKILRRIRAERKVDQRWWIKALSAMGGAR